MLYGYGYRRSYTCSFNIADNSIQPTNLVGIASIVRKSGTSIVIYTCTLPTALPYEYIPLAQFTTNRTEATTVDNDFAPLTAKYIDNSTVQIAVERTAAGNNVSILVHLVEK